MTETRLAAILEDLLWKWTLDGGNAPTVALNAARSILEEMSYTPPDSPEDDTIDLSAIKG
jgi:hypothetical protein